MINWIEVKKIKKNKVRFGWYDVVDDIEVSKLLIEEVINYGKENKLNFVEGPVGFSNLDKAGLLIKGYDDASHEPEWFTTAPVEAIKKTLSRVGWSVDDVDLWEVNEAFAVVTMAAMHDLRIGHSVMNVNGGACALGHPIGASGARILVTLIHALRQQSLKRGIASLCIGGGEATAMAVEII